MRGNIKLEYSGMIIKDVPFKNMGDRKETVKSWRSTYKARFDACILIVTFDEQDIKLTTHADGTNSRGSYTPRQTNLL